MTTVNCVLKIVIGSVLALVLGCGSVPPPELRVHFIGNAAVAVTDGSTTLVSDFPYQSGVYGYMTYDRAAVALAGDVTLLITHSHEDHWDATALRDDAWRILGPADVTARLPTSRVVPMAASVTIGRAVVTPHRTPHAGLEHYSYEVEWHGRRVYFSGDTEDATSLPPADRLDVAFVTPWLLTSTLRGDGRLPAERVVVYHHTCDEEVAGCSGQCLVPRQGDSWIVHER